MNAVIRGLNAELKLNTAQIKGAGESTELLKSRQSILKSELSASREKVVLLNNKLEEAKKVFGKNSAEVKTWEAKLGEARAQQQNIQNELNGVTEKLKEQNSAQKQLADTLAETDSKMQMLDQELQLNETKLEGAGNKTELLKERQKLLGEQSQNASEKVKALEDALSECEKEVGANAEEYTELKSKLTEAKIEQEEIKNKIKETTKELKEQKTATQLASEGFSKAGDGLEKAGQSMKRASTVAGGALVGIATSAVTFESAFAGVKKTTDEVYDANGKCVYSYQQLEDGIRNMAKEIPASTTEISKVAETAGQLGIKTEDVLGFTRVMVDMGVSTDLASEEAATAIAKMANVTGLAADKSMSAEEKYSRMGSTIVDLGNKYATTEKDIVAMAQNLASAGTQVGMSEADILALATSLSSVGMEAQAGGTAFSKAMVMMQLAVETNSDKLKEFADVAGMSTSEFSRLFKEDATGALQAFIQGLSECGGESKSAIKVLDDMGIKETRLRDSLLRSANASDVFSSAIKTGRQAWKENTALSEEAAKRYETTASQLEIMRNNIKDVGITLGATFLPMINKGIKAVVGFTEKIANMDEGTQKNILGVLAFVTALAPMLIGLGKVSKGISVILKVGSGITGMFSGMGAVATEAGGTAAAGMALPMMPILAIIAGIGGVVAILATLWTKSESFRNFFTGMFEGLKQTVSGFVERIKFGGQIDEIKGKFEGLREKLGGLENAFKVIGTVVAVIAVPAIAVLAGAFNALISIANGFITMIGGVIDTIAGLGDIIVGAFTGNQELAQQGAQKMVNGISQIFKGLWGMTKGAFVAFLNGIKAFFGGLLSACGVTKFASGVVSSIKDMGAKALSTVKTKFESVKTAISKPIQTAYKTVNDTFSKIKSSMSKKIDEAKDKVKSGVEKIKSALIFKWSLPKLKMPHFSVSGKFSLNPPKVPKFDITWRAKGAIFKKATIFDTRAGWQGVGEAGPEAVAPITLLRSYVEESVERAMLRMQYDKKDTIDYEKLARTMERVNITMKCRDREVARTIRSYG